MGFPGLGGYKANFYQERIVLIVFFFYFQCDQPKEGLVNNPSKMDEYCREKGFSTWFETSAKENINIEEAARSLVTKVSFGF